jgi:RHS repeat-associated protein
MTRITRIIYLLIFFFSFTGYAVEYPEAFVEESDPLGEASNALDILSGEPSTIVHHAVNVVSGDYIDMQTDLTLPGKELFLQRFYCSNDASCLNPFRAWKFNHDISVYQPVKGSKSDLVLSDAFGAKIACIKYKRNGGCLEYLVHAEVFEKRITNTAREMSGRWHLKNKLLQRSVRDDILLVKDGAGGEYHFARPHNKHKMPILRLIKPNGNQIHYQYDQDKIPTLIKAVNREGNIFGQFEFKRERMQPDLVSLEASSSHGTKATYILSKVKSEKKSKWILRKAISSEAPCQTYQYDEDYKKIVRKDLPEYRFLEIQYYPSGDSQKGKVMALKAPVGRDSTSIPIYRFAYHADTKKKKQNSRTEVYDAHQHQKVYHFGRDERLNKIEHFTGTSQYQLYSQEQFFWGAPDTQEAGDLFSKVFSLADGKRVFCRTYSYDFGSNITREYLYGNLSGTCKASLVVDDTGKPIPNGCECLVIGHEYTKNHRNLVKYENHPEHAHDYLYEYHEGIGLIKGQYTVEGEAVRLREFFDYDASNSITTEIVDDGSSLDGQNLTNVTERRIKRIRNCQSFPLGLPETIEEKYLDLATGQERLLKKLHNHYDQQGRLCRRTVYDSEGAQSYTLEWKYNMHGCVIEETNALGQTTAYAYDSNDNRIFTQGPNKDVHNVYAYDYMNRLIREEEVWNDGTRLVQAYQYDYLGNRVARTDIYGNEIQYSYDDFSRLKKIVYPSVLDENGQHIRPTVEKEYDALGYETALTDANGAKTTSLYTIHGKPYFIQHPDGSQEQFEYTLKGQRTKAVARNGSYTLYSYDYLSRPVKEEMYSSNGTLLTAIARVYNAFHLLQETDAAGCSTYYRYDGAGRLACVEKDNSRTKYMYDSLGRQSKKREFFGPENTQYLDTVYSFDLLDRLLTETVQDASGQVCNKIAYSYDAAGNRQEVITYNQAGISIEKTKYNPHGDPIESINALGDATHICYHYPVANRTETTDPLGRVTISTQDALSRTICVEQKNALGQLIKKSEYRHDAVGNRRSHIETVLTPQEAPRQVVTTWNYNNMGNVTEVLEAFGTSNQKNTRYIYNQAGQVTSKIKADGSILRYSYDALGRLQDYSSSDDSFHYTYEYDLKDNPIQVNDLKNGTRTSKEFDRLNRLTKETLGHGLVLGYAYDRMGRLTALTLPDQSKIKYGYQGLYLHQAVRLNAEGNSRYTHTYEAYDLAGNPTQATLIQKAGTAEYHYDLLARLKQTTASNFKETLDVRDSMGNLTKRTLQDSVGIAEGVYGYDDLDQLQLESGIIKQSFAHDSHYNQLSKDEMTASVNCLNQLTELGESHFKYDQNGNRILKQSAQEEVRYGYDAKDRLVEVVNEGKKVVYQYDSSDRCLTKISYRKEGSDWQQDKTIRYLYQGLKEIGAYDAQGNSVELKVLSPKGAVALELQGQVFAPLYDYLGNVVSLIKGDGTPYETYRYSAFGEEQLFDGNGQAIEHSLNPWRYAGKRKDDDIGLVYFGKRYYDPTISRWLTPDPAGFIDGMNLYAYVHNNPFKYNDLDGRFAIALVPLISIAFGIEMTITTATMITIGQALTAATLTWGAYELAHHVEFWVDSKYQSMNETLTEEETTQEPEKRKGRKPGRDNAIKGGPPRDPKTANYLPDPAAEGVPHTTTGIKEGRNGPYTQGATFDADGKFRGRTDVTDHGRPIEHPYPHYHPETGPNSADSPAQRIPKFFGENMI